MNTLISFLYTVDPDADEPIMLIDRHIGFDEVEGFGIMGDLFQKELLALDGMDKKRIQVWINSPGGIVTDGYNIYNAMLKTKTKVDTYNMGIAASIAAVCFQGGRTRVMADYSKLMYHNPFGGDDDKGLDAMRDSIATMIATRTGKSNEEIQKLMNKTTWMGADEALENGFCDEIESTGQLNKKRAVKTPDQAKALWTEAGNILNNLFKTENTSTMKNVANKLKLNQDASESSIIAEIESIENKAKSAEQKAKDKEEELNKKQEQMDGLQKECDKLKDELKDLKAKNEEEMKAKAEAEKATKAKAEQETEEKAKNMIEGFVKGGRIKNDAKIIADWTTKAKADLEGVKNLIESLPINKASSKINIESGKGEYKPGSVIANAMTTKRQELMARGAEVK